MKPQRKRDAPTAEHWHVDAGSASVAVITVPGALHRRRVFDIDATLLVRVPQDHEAPWHELTLELDGKQQWQRRIPSASPGQTDGLDYHCRVVLEAGPTLRIRAVARCAGSRVVQLMIEAREDLQD
jgi:hypothetical protein